MTPDSDKNWQLLKLAKERMDSAYSHDEQNRSEGLKDLEFLALDQWPENVRKQREAEDRPVLTLDKLNQHKNQVVNDIRQANIEIKAIPSEDGDADIAEIYTALMRDIQHQSHASHAYSHAADGAVSCGIGHFRFTTDYVKDRVFEQEISIKAIPYHLACYWDPAATDPVKTDAEWLFVTEFMPIATFEGRYPNAAIQDFEAPRQETDDASGVHWKTDDGVLIAEYWWKEPVTKKIVAFEDGAVLDMTDREAEIPMESEIHGAVIGERDAKGWKIMQALISGAEILEGPNEWAGNHFPIIPVCGPEIHLEDTTVRMSLIRAARDAQQLYNYWRSAAAESIALAPKSKWLLTPAQIARFTQDWNVAHIASRPYLLFNPDSKMPGHPKREDPPSPPAAMWQEAALVTEDIKAATGIYDASLGARSNETSGIAIRRRKEEGDVATFHFSDNLERSLEHAGTVLVDLIPRIYDTKRAIRIMGEDKEPMVAQINWPTVNEWGVPISVGNDLTRGRYDVRVTIGPSNTTARVETRELLIQYAQADPQALPAFRDKLAAALDFQGSQEVAERFKRMVPPELLSPEEREQNQDPNAAQQQQQMAMQQQMLEVKVREIMAEIMKDEAQAKKLIAEAQQTELENAAMQQQHALEDAAKQDVAQQLVEQGF